MKGFTHLCFGLALGEILGLSPKWVAIFSVAPDVDLFLSHRGILHSPIFALAISPFFGKLKKPFLVGYLSHIFLDAFTPYGVPILFTRFSISMAWMEPYVLISSLIVILYRPLQFFFRKHLHKVTVLTLALFIFNLSAVNPIRSPARLQLEGERVRAVTYGFAQSEARFRRKLHIDSVLKLNEFSIDLEGFKGDGFLFVEGFYEPDRNRMVRVRHAYLLGTSLLP